jgi:superfamily II DNA or RNA helicase
MYSIESQLKDHSFEGDRIEVNFHGQLTSQQVDEIYGQIIVDECRHNSAFSFEQVLKQVRAKYVHGLCYAKSKGWPTPHHIYAVWANPL